jgi:HAMP domain-containing protein/CHASE3 domain sensor protein
MSIKARLLTYFSVILLSVIAVGGFSIINGISLNKSAEQKLSDSVGIVQKTSKQSVIAQLVRYDDEVLTQSARNYAFTGDKKWKDRYYEFAPKLDLRIKEAKDFGDQTDIDIFNSISASNDTLVALEEKAIGFVDNKDLSSAVKILESKEYWDQKAIYKAGLDEYIALHALGQIDSADAISTETLQKSVGYLAANQDVQIYSMVALVILSLATLAFLFFIIIKIFMTPLNLFKKTAREITKGNYNAKVDIKNNDEIGEFADDFNKMTQELRSSIENIAEKVEEKTSKLEEEQIITKKALDEANRANKLMVGRELEMIELKKQIAELKNKK